MTWTMMTVAIELWKICTMRKMHLCRIWWNFRQHSERDSGNEQKSFSEKCHLWISVRGSVQSTFNPSMQFVPLTSSCHYLSLCLLFAIWWHFCFSQMRYDVQQSKGCVKYVSEYWRNMTLTWSKWKLHSDIRKDINH